MANTKDRGLVEGGDLVIESKSLHKKPPPYAGEIPYEWLRAKLKLQMKAMQAEGRDSAVFTFNGWELQHLSAVVEEKYKQRVAARDEAAEKRRKKATSKRQATTSEE